MRWLRTYAVTVYGLVTLGLIAAGNAAHIQYDSGLHGLLFHFFLTPVLGFVFYVPHEMLFYAGGGRSFHGHAILSAIIGLLFCGGVDYVRHRFRTRRKKSV